MEHVPVLKAEVLQVLAPKRGERVLDCTLGLGGHSAAFLEAIGSEGFLVGIDADRGNLMEAKRRLGSPKNMEFLHVNFGKLPECLPPERREFDVIFADLGLSSPHLDVRERGFSFKDNSPLDMRFDQSAGMTAAMFLASTDPKTLFQWFADYGELPRMRAFVDALVEARAKNPIATSEDLKKIAEKIYGYRTKDYLAQIFQALRIAVNDELGALTKLLSSAPSLLAIGGRFGVLTYHSLEDRAVKQNFRALTSVEKDPVTGAGLAAASFELLTKKGMSPTDAEVKENPRSRSALLRAVRKQSAYTVHRS